MWRRHSSWGTQTPHVPLRIRGGHNHLYEPGRTAFATPLAPPSSISFSNRNQQSVIVSWDKVDSATSYAISIALAGCGSGYRQVATKVKQTSFVLSDLQASAFYTVKVFAGADGAHEEAGCEAAVPLPTSFLLGDNATEQTAISVVSVTSTSVSLKWLALKWLALKWLAVLGATHYQLDWQPVSSNGAINHQSSKPSASRGSRTNEANSIISTLETGVE
jgi:hypothetical protein